MNSRLFDLEYLQKLTYERSKTWANVLGTITKNEQMEVISIDELNNPSFYKFEKEDSDEELASMDDDCEDEPVDSHFVKTLANNTRFSLYLNKTLSLPEGHKNEKETELIDIFNQTLPIINEHDRQLKESGFDKILSSFDKKIIEDKVGNWLNRHNSLFGGENAVLNASTKNASYRTDEREFPKLRKGNQYEEYISEDSLQSGETARYIRSSRSGTVKHYASTNTLIKTYRRVNCTRETLLETKYKDQEKYNSKTVHRSGRTAHMNTNYLYEQDRSRQFQKYEKQTISLQKQRRKVLRKRFCSSSCMSMDLSSDSDYSYDCNRKCCHKTFKPCCSEHHCSAAKYNCYKTSASKTIKTKHCTLKMPSALKNRICFSHSHQHSLSTSSLTSNNSGSEGHRTNKKRNLKLNNDKRPYKLESECRCCNEKKLCEDYQHIVNSSTEEWYVENNCSPRKLLYKDLSTATTKIGTDSELNCTDEELNLAIKTSIETYKQEQKAKKEKEKQKLKLLSNKALKNTQKIKDNFESQNKSAPKRPTTRSNDVNSKEIVEKMPKLVEDTSTEPMKKLTEDKNIEDKDFSVKSYSSNMSAMTSKDSTKTNKEISSFTSDCNQKIYNSTALSSKIPAHNRQISQYQQDRKTKSKNDLEKRMNKTLANDIKIQSSNKKVSKTLKKDSQNKKIATSTVVTSTTIPSPQTNNILLISSDSEQNGINCEENSDCTIVTSTTNIGPSLSKTNNEKIKNEPKRNSPETSRNHQLMQKDILIYAPEQRSSNSSKHFIATKDHLAQYIGEKQADKFFKYYIGRKHFNCNSTVYYRPPKELTAIDGDSSADSDDIFANINRCGDLYECVDKSIKVTKSNVGV